MLKVKRNSFAKNHKTFAKISVASLIIFALSFGCWLDFRGNPHNFAKAIDAPTETIRAITADDGGDPWIRFDGAEYVDTGVTQIGQTDVQVDFKYDNAAPLGSRVFGAQYPGDSLGGQQAIALARDVNTGNNQPTWLLRYSRNSNFIWFGTWDTERHVFQLSNGTYALGDTVDDLTIYGTATSPVPDDHGGSIYLSATHNTATESANYPFYGDIYNFKLWKGTCSISDFVTQPTCVANGGIWTRELVRNFVPAVRYTCGDDVEYGFIDIANGDQWYGNLGAGTLIGSENVVAPECPAAPEPEPTPSDEPPTSSTETPPVAKPTAKNSVGAPNTGIAN